jgi:hypothetical protein
MRLPGRCGPQRQPESDAPPAWSKAQLEKGAKGAPAAVSAAGLKCTIKEAADVGETMVDQPDKKKAKAEIYEVACSEGPGFVLQHVEGGSTAVISCLQQDAAYAQTKKGLRCALPENADTTGQAQALFDQTGGKCKVANYGVIGATTEFTRFEVACSDGGGYEFDVLKSGQVKPAVITCLQASSGGNPCKLTTKAQILTSLAPLATQGDKTCQPSDVRWVGATKEGNGFIEFGCTGKPGFMVETSPAGAFVKSMDCIEAQVYGGCKFTDLASAKSGAAQGYTGQLKAQGVDCNAQDFHQLGTETRSKRDVVEFKCPERPWGLVALFPQAGSASKFEQMDCITAAVRAVTCTLLDKTVALGKLKAILTAVDKVCDPTDYKVIGPGDFGEVVEVKCSAGQSGYVVDLPAGRAATKKTMSCAQAKGGINECTIPGNS